MAFAAEALASGAGIAVGAGMADVAGAAVTLAAAVLNEGGGDGAETSGALPPGGGGLFENAT